ncbi:hypothetical protein [Algoriphagus confluentis]|uniref:Gliding motility-associated C-terminal domain-containing protein n=1 Tax=Algoriphagus confluentis TaxID=1697556 RepID=A0ABQ6PU80_9BACT|nr:hypothetical protein Aconfl_29500 [Algoriphagus confluentis]
MISIQSSIVLFAFSFILSGPVSDEKLALAGEEKSASIAFDPELTGPDRLCNVFGSILADYFGGGNPATDVYSWELTGPSGQLLFKGSGGAGFQTLSYTFSLIGVHQIKLVVSRGGIIIGNLSKEVEVVQGPLILLKPNYTICENQPIFISAIDPTSSNFAKYTFEWKDGSGNVIGNQNTVEAANPGTYSVSFFFENTSGIDDCVTSLSTQVNLAPSYSITSNASSLCPDLSITFSSSPSAEGEWFYQKVGDPELIALGPGTSKTLSAGKITKGFGDYLAIFKVPNPNNPACIQQSQSTFTFNPLPEIEFVSANGATECLVADGTLILEAVTFIDLIFIDGLGISMGPFNPGDPILIPGLKSGAYTITAQLGNCTNSLASVVPLLDPPVELTFEIEDIEPEKCTDTGKINGSFLVKLLNGPVIDGSYRILNSRGGIFQNQALGNETELLFDVPGGRYFFEIYDKDSCNLPKSEVIDVPSLQQVAFSIPDSLSICQSFDLIPETSQALEFSLLYLVDGSETVQPAGEAFTLTQPGEYSLVGRLPNQDLLCPLQRNLTVTVVDPVDFEPVLIDQDCFGNRTYEANLFGRDPDSVLFRWLDENDDLVGTGQFLNPISFGTYKLDVQPANSTACPIPPLEFEISQPVLSVEVTLTSTKLCEFGPRAIISLSTTFPEEITDIEWRRYDDLGNIENLPQYKNQNEITVDVAGNYEAAVFSRIPSINKDCELGRNSLDLDLIPNKVPFTVVDSLSICDPYSLIPESEEPLEFELIFPDGKTEIKGWNEAFSLDQEGTYTILGYDPTISGPLCPDQKTIEVKINPRVVFSPQLTNQSCVGEYEYRAEVENYPADSVDYFWRNPAGTLVSTQAILTTSTYGTFSLEVQPKGSIPCGITPVEFEIPVPILEVEVDLIGETLCPDQPDAALTLSANLETVQTIQWWFTDLSNNTSQLATESGKTEILALEEGTYEVRLFNAFGCLLGMDSVLVIRSTDQNRPRLEESYQICPRYEIAPMLNPGNFASYEWYFEDNLVSTSPTYKPSQIGTFHLIVISQEGCAYRTEFETEEECELRVIFPNAIQPGNPNLPFLIYTNYLIDELEVWIYNKWGNPVFHCKNSDLIKEESTCFWDGYVNGEKALPGAYAYRVWYRNIEKNISKDELGAILVID